jgi:hypothetical protein
MGVGEIIGLMFVGVSVLLLCLEWLSKIETSKSREPQSEGRVVVRHRARR